MKTAIDSEVLESMAHTMNKTRSILMETQSDAFADDCMAGWSQHDENDFWKFIQALPKRIQESVIN